MSPAGLPSILAICVLALSAWAGEGTDDGSFGLTEPVACREIHGYEDYVVLPGAALTADEKLLVYYRPLHYKSARVDGKYEVHLTQDGRVRRRGEKAVLWSKPRLLDYKVRDDSPPRLIALRNTIALKGLRPGEYELDVVLRDEVGQSAPAVRSLPFRVLPSPGATGGRGAADPDQSAAPSSKGRSRRSPKSSDRPSGSFAARM